MKRRTALRRGEAIGLRIEEQLYREHRDAAHGFLLRLTGYRRDLAEELTQETLYRAILSLPRFRGQCEMRSWVFQIAKNVFWEHLRRVRREERTQRALQGERAEAAPSPGDRAEARAFVAAVHDALAAFASPMREVMLYRLFSDLPYAQIAALLHIGESAARVAFHRGKVKLQDALKGEYGYGSEL